MFWDDSAGAHKYLTAGTGLTITDTTIESSGSGGANTALSNLASVAINTTLVSDTDNTDALGTTAIAWSDIFLGSGAVITFNSAPSTADVTLTHSADTLTLAGGTLVTAGDIKADTISIQDSTNTYWGIFNITDAMTASRNVNFTLGDADRTISLASDFTLPADPNADRILFWDDSAGATKYLTVGAGLAITDVTIAATGSGGGITWSEVTGTSQSAAVNSGYICNNAGLVTVTLPTTAAVGDVVRISGKGAGGWLVAQNASEIIHFGNVDTTTGVGGSLASTHRRDAVELVCVVADTEWNVLSSLGNITYV